MKLTNKEHIIAEYTDGDIATCCDGKYWEISEDGDRYPTTKNNIDCDIENGLAFKLETPEIYCNGERYYA